MTTEARKSQGPGTTAVVAVLPSCDWCAAGGKPESLARYDFRTSTGQWGNGCAAHFRIWSPTGRLGVGIGQRLVTSEEDGRF